MITCREPERAPQPPAKPPQPNQPSSAFRLGWVARAACGLVGGAAGVFGVIGVFQKDASSIGVPVLLVLAAFFAYIAVSGQRLRSVKVGEYEAGFEQLAQVVTYEVLENQAVPAEVKTDVAAALGDVRAELPSSTQRAVSEAIFAAQNQDTYERALRTELQRLFADDYVGDYPFLDGSKAVWLQRGQQQAAQRGIAIWPKFVSNPQVKPEDLGGFFNEVGGPMNLMLVSNAPLDERAEARIASALLTPDYASAIQWRDPRDNVALTEAIKRRLERKT